MTAPSATGARRPVTGWNHLRAVLLLPFMNTVVIPSVLLLLFRDATWGRAPMAPETAAATVAVAAKTADTVAETAAAAAALVVGVVVAAAGLVLVMQAIALFVRRGQGTLAPWDPTRVLIVEGVYRYSRNPMKAGLFLVLIGECLVFRSPALAVWACCFVAANVAYIRWHEEPGLHQRFGEAYRAYCRRVPRWLPRGSSLAAVAVAPVGTSRPEGGL